MPNTKISALTAVTTPASTDELAVNQGGASKKMTRAQVHALESGEHLILPRVNEPTTPTLGFGDGGAGFYEENEDTIALSRAGTKAWEFSSILGRNANSGSAFRNVDSSATVPNILPAVSDLDTGIGHRTANVGVLIGGALNCMEFANIAAAPGVGFFGTAAVVKPTGVAVSAAGVHAALVTLGLIAGP